MYFSSNAGTSGYHVWRQRYPGGAAEQLTFGPTEQEGTAIAPDVPLETLWPKGLNSEEAVLANPGAKVINEANAFPASSLASYLSWRRVTQSNLYRVSLPN